MSAPVARAASAPSSPSSIAQLSRLKDGLPLAAGEIEDLYPLSPMQQGMLFHSLYEQAAGNYINQLRVDVHGLDMARFRTAWQARPSTTCGCA